MTFIILYLTGCVVANVTSLALLIKYKDADELEYEDIFGIVLTSMMSWLFVGIAIFVLINCKIFKIFKGDK